MKIRIEEKNQFPVDIEIDFKAEIDYLSDAIIELMGKIDNYDDKRAKQVAEQKREGTYYGR